MKMMHTISSTPENHMTTSAVAACMAPLLLQPILAGECNLNDDVEFSDDDSGQLLAAAYAAKTAQAIITLMLEEYQYIFSVSMVSLLWLVVCCNANWRASNEKLPKCQLHLLFYVASPE